MKIPGPDHPITIEPNAKPVRIRFAGDIIVESSRALRLKEASYPPVFYIPREDIDMTLFSPSDTTSHCPYKGDASYFSITADGRTSKDAAWSYEAPYPAAAGIAGCLAFYPDRVDAIEEVAA